MVTALNGAVATIAAVWNFAFHVVIADVIPDVVALLLPPFPPLCLRQPLFSRLESCAPG